MPVHFSAEEMQSRRDQTASAVGAQELEGLLMFKQESMYYLTGYDSFGFSMFQCLVMDAAGRVALLTRLPDLRQAQYTSDPGRHPFVARRRGCQSRPASTRHAGEHGSGW